MDGMVEISIVRQVVNSDPLDWFTSPKTRANRFQIRTISPNLFVAIHADARGRDSGRGSSFYRGVTVAAINTVISNVVFMAKLYRLLPLEPLAGIPGRPINLGRNPKRGHQNEDGAKNADLG